LPVKPELGDQLRRVGLEAFVALYCFALGATIGSFLNVVVYRMPRGLNIVHPGSRCPGCGTSISLLDNIPIVSWLRLRGRCRSCSMPISPRYLAVEAAMGMLFVGLLYVEVLSGGRNLPLVAPKLVTDIIAIHWGSMWDLVRIALFHAFLLGTLLACVLIQADGFALPRSLLGTASLLMWGLPILWPDLRPVPALVVATGNLVPPRTSLEAAFVDAPAGVLIGLAAGLVLCLACRRESLAGKTRAALVPLMAMIGLALGWQAVLSVALLAASGRLVAALVSVTWSRAAGVPPAAFPAVAAMVHIALWKPLSGLAWWPGPGTAWLGGLASVMLAIQHAMSAAIQV
jgi:leader peptidase (prepilin peptidase)/N-methyltransferase